MCSQVCHQACILDSLDQTRFETIMCSNQLSVLWVLKALSTGD
jgi:coenzyme F420-reducing hydrogenase delta subunit